MEFHSAKGQPQPASLVSAIRLYNMLTIRSDATVTI
jgi:hypothetical protein